MALNSSDPIAGRNSAFSSEFQLYLLHCIAFAKPDWFAFVSQHKYEHATVANVPPNQLFTLTQQLATCPLERAYGSTAR